MSKSLKSRGHAPLGHSSGTVKRRKDGDPGTLHRRLAHQLRDALWSPGSLSPTEIRARAQAAIDTLKGLAPRDELEGMLAVHIVATYRAALDCLQRAADPDRGAALQAKDLQQAQKLMTLFLRQQEAYDRHRERTLAARFKSQAQDTDFIPLVDRLKFYAREIEEAQGAATQHRVQPPDRRADAGGPPLLESSRQSIALPSQDRPEPVAGANASRPQWMSDPEPLWGGAGSWLSSKGGSS